MYMCVCVCVCTHYVYIHILCIYTHINHILFIFQLWMDTCIVPTFWLLRFLFFSFRVSMAYHWCPRKVHTCRFLGPCDNEGGPWTIIPWRGCSWQEVLAGIWETKREDLQPGNHNKWGTTLQKRRREWSEQGECGCGWAWKPAGK